MEFTISQIAEMLNGEVIGNPNVCINQLTKIEEGCENSLSFLSNPKYTEHLYKTKSSAVIHCLKIMRFPYRFMSLVVWLCPKGIRNVAYDFVAKRRKSFFGTSDSCVWDAFPSNLGAER